MWIVIIALGVMAMALLIFLHHIILMLNPTSGLDYFKKMVYIVVPFSAVLYLFYIFS